MDVFSPNINSTLETIYEFPVKLAELIKPKLSVEHWTLADDLVFT